MHKRFAIGLLAAAIVLGLAVAKRHELLRGALGRARDLPAISCASAAFTSTGTKP